MSIQAEIQAVLMYSKILEALKMIDCAHGKLLLCLVVNKLFYLIET